MSWCKGIIASLIFIANVGVCFAANPKRVALVIGNESYQNTAHLANPKNDATAIAQKLVSIGFDVSLHIDLTGQDFRVALGEFTEKAIAADVAMVFYAGHGIEMNGQNYLIPIDARMRSEATAQFEAISLDGVLSTIRQTGKLGMVLLDACRDNPFAKTIERKNKSRSASRGLANVNVEQESGVLISFAAQAGNTADDGTGIHSPYTTALLDVLDKPGLEVGRMFRRVRARVKADTNGTQVPIERMQLPDEEIYLVPPDASTSTVNRPIANDTPQNEDPLLVYLNAIETGTRKPLELFVSKYPDHFKASDARKLLVRYAEDEYWEKTKTSDTEKAYENYLLAFSGGRYKSQAETRLLALKTEVAPLTSENASPPTCAALNGNWSVQSVKTNDTLFVRSGPGQNYDAIGELAYNADGISNVSCRSDNWCQVTYGCISGYSFGRYLTNRNGGHAASAFAGSYMVIDHPMDSMLNVRSGPGTNYTIVAELPPNADGVHVTDCQIEKGYKYRWCNLSWGEISGWGYGRYLQDSFGAKPVPAKTAVGGSCHDLWIQRNTIFQQRGYCFGSTKGKKYFDNTGCFTTNPQLNASEKNRVRQIEQREAAQGC